MYIYILQLTHRKIFVHASSSTMEEDIYREYCLLYEYSVQYKPIKIIDTILIENIDFSLNPYIRNMFMYEINKYVKQYMFCYPFIMSSNEKPTILDGIMNVRGGSYIDDILPPYIIKTLEHELKTMFIEDELYSSFFTHQSFLTDENQQLYLNKKKKYDSFMKIDMTLCLEHIQWLYSICTTETIHIRNNKENIEKYKKTISFIKTLFPLYMNCVKENDEKEIDSPFMICMKYPEFTFDPYFYHNKRTKEYHFSDIDGTLWKTFELLYYTVYNKIEELKFDLSFFPKYMDQFIEIKRRYTPDMEKGE